MDTVRLGIIGIGNMGSSHAINVYGGKIKNCVLTAICDTNPKRIAWAKNKFGDSVKLYNTDKDFFEDAPVDAILVATPHYDHCPLAIWGFECGFHVLCEKPSGVYTKQVREMIDAAEKSGKTFAMMFNQRILPVYQKLHEIMEKGYLGELKRFTWHITNWFRSQAYYDSSTWRATWKGEGGGVLLNQDPHQLDLWQWIVGMPKEITAFMDFGKCRNIEVENDVTAFFRYENGATGTFVTSTHEAPGSNRMELSGDNGKIIVEDNKITFYRNTMSATEFNEKVLTGFGEPEVWKIEIPVKGEDLAHNGIIQNFVNNIISGEPLVARGEEGIRGLMLSNAMHMSAWTGKTVEIDKLDEDLYYELLQDRIKNSKFEKKENDVVLDVSGTF